MILLGEKRKQVKRREAFIDCPINLKQLSTLHVKQLNHTIFHIHNSISLSQGPVARPGRKITGLEIKHDR